MPNSSKFIFFFLFSFFTLFICEFFFVTYSDPYKILNFPWATHCSKNLNRSLKKFQQLESFNGAQAIIIGSSTGDAYTAEAVEHFYGTRAFHAGVHGADTYERTLFFNKAVEKYHDLKYVFYISDFFEYNGSSINLDLNISRQKDLRRFLLKSVQSEIEPLSIKTWIEEVFSFKVFSSSLHTFIKCLQEDVEKQPSAEERSVQFIDFVEMSRLVKEDPIHAKSMDQDLALGIKRHLNGPLKNFYSLSLKPKAIMKHIAKQANINNIQLVIILSPYHPKFKKMINDSHLKRLRQEWIQFVYSLASKNVHVFDYEKSTPFPDSSRFWHDGHHLQVPGGQIILEDISKTLFKF